MIKIDAHQHFWKYNPIRDTWIDESMEVIRKDFLPNDLAPILQANGIAGCVAVQADQSETETAFLLNLAAENDCIKGVVGWVDILANDLSESLAHYSKNSYFKGIRHIAQGEADDFLERPDVMRGISQLEQYNLTYDILVYAHQLPAAIQLVQHFPNQAFVLDHIAKPKISAGLSNEWTANIKKLAAFPNINCKVSGMVTETNNFHWEQADFKPFLDTIVEAFGIDRILYGSDWPVCLLAAPYKEQLAIVQDYFTSFSLDNQAKVMGHNAIEFYNLARAIG